MAAITSSVAHGVIRSAWTDKFRRPGVVELRSGLPKAMHRVFDDAREGLSPEGVAESIEWQGVPWRWTLVFTAAGCPEGPKAFAYLVPCPDRVQVCVPLTQGQVDGLPLKRLKRSIRDGVALARVVAGVWWATWDIPGRGALDDVLDLAMRKHKLIVTADARETVTA